ncbi:MAG: S1 RNA-binding domain-containing protein [Ruminococcus sp.]|nr:S1 RNA-binding domain-containing protein [Ruminococcus sp.]
MNRYLPEGFITTDNAVNRYTQTELGMNEAMDKGLILEAKALMCTGEHDIIVDLPCGRGIIRREEGALGIKEGTTRDIALLSKVGKKICFKVTDICDEGEFRFILSRRAAQEDCFNNYISKLVPGDVIPAKVTHLERFGCFVDIGCGIPSLIPIDAISVSRISHPNDRFYNGQNIKVVVKGIEGDKILLTHKELLGTWEENTARFSVGQTVSGIVRSVEDYGVFIELAPNLAGLAESRENIYPGQTASVFIKAIIPEKMKVKLIIVDVFDTPSLPIKFDYFTDKAHIDSWIYSAPGANKIVETYF